MGLGSDLCPWPHLRLWRTALSVPGAGLCRSPAHPTDLTCLRSVGRPKHMRVMAGALEGDLFMGPKAEVTYACGVCLDLGVGSS